LVQLGFAAYHVGADLQDQWHEHFEFAYRNLFDPLGVTADDWARDPQGYFMGAASVYLTPRELAQFGLLYLRRGQWNGAQIVPTEWVAESLKPYIHVERKSDVDPQADWWLAPEVTGYDVEFDYGYYWWINTIGGHAIYSAIGWGGQRLHLIPDLDMVIVITTLPRRTLVIDSFGLIEQYIIPSTGTRR
jgi:CubicO group peptidase (beta-lactamase class C family)